MLSFPLNDLAKTRLRILSSRPFWRQDFVNTVVAPQLLHARLPTDHCVIGPEASKF